MPASNAPSGGDAAISQPMAKSSSNGPDSAKESGVAGASPYGTRSSRSKTGQNRPNYAEDKDIDMDFLDTYGEKRDDGSKKSSRNSNPAAQDAPRSANGNRKPLPSGDARSLASQNASKEPAPAPAASAPTVNQSAAHSSKKRKAASQTSASNGAPQTTTTTTVPTSAQGARKAAVTQQAGKGFPETNMLTFDNCKARPKNGQMIADDGTVLEVNDHVYLVCEPPGEPYYLGRIMEFMHVKNDSSLPVDALRINWYYRPKDIGRKVQDTRLVFATMHSDISPLTSLRGKCQIRHKAAIDNFGEYRKTPDCFWFDKLYDRYIQKNYEVIPTSQIVNVPERVKKVLDERWKFILVEQGRGKELTSAVKSCKRCTGYCASNDSVDCAVCQNTYHMNCVKPPLLKKPSRGFAWSCAACSRAQERKLEARNTPNVLDPNGDAEDEEYLDDEEDDAAGLNTNRTSPEDGIDDSHEPATAEQIYHASLWPWRYLGIHCKPEDALDYDDRIYPRASSRLGPRHQATVTAWPGRPVEYVKPLEIKKGGKRDSKLSKEAQAALENERIKRENRPKWVQDEPIGYVRRGEDLDNDDPNNTAQLLYKPPPATRENVTSAYVENFTNAVKPMWKELDLPERSTNLLDVGRDLLFKFDYDAPRALKMLPNIEKSAFKEPGLTATEKKKFEEGVAKFGSELISVKRHVKTLKPATVVRFYYTWKKSESGKAIWGNYSGRKGKKEAKKADALASKLADDVADDADDSAFDAQKAMDKKRSFMCKFCGTKSSRQWRRAPHASSLVHETSGKNKDKGGQFVVALCRRCAELWRRYAIQWEDVDEVARKLAQAGGRAWKRRIDEDLLKELTAANEMMSQTVYNTPDRTTTANSSTANSTHADNEPPRKKLKAVADKDLDHNMSDTGSVSGAIAPKKKEKAAEKPPAPAVPEMPKPKALPCAVCGTSDLPGDQRVTCRECRMTVHRNCYGIIDNRNAGKWVCDTCINDKNPQVSINYKCALCPVEDTEHDFVELPKVSHKKKTEKEKERERMEKENAIKAAAYYRQKQVDMNRPVNPREPLKRTVDNNWVHVTCAIFTPEVKFGNARALEPSEGISSIPRNKYAEVCKACKHTGGACVACHQCRAPVHVACAHQHGFVLGFDITPIKGSRRDQFNIVTINGETGTMTAAIWCKEHAPTKTYVHRMSDPVEEAGINALQLYVQNFKQADLALTGCARKANLISAAAKLSTSPTSPTNRRGSLIPSPIEPVPEENTHDNNSNEENTSLLRPGGKICLTCGVDVSARWHRINDTQERAMANGDYGNIGEDAQKFMAQRSFQCHKCKKAGRQPKPHAPPPAEQAPIQEAVAAAQTQAQSLVEPVTAARSLAGMSPPAPFAEPANVTRSPYSWAQAATTSHQSSSHRPGPPLVQVPHSQPPPSSGPPPPLPPTMGSHVSPPLAAHAYPAPPQPPSTPYGEWHRTTSQHIPPAPHPPHHLNGGPHGGPPSSMPPASLHPLAPPNHLRPPPIQGVPPPPSPAPPLQNGQIGQAAVNGVPPAPRRLSGPPPLQNGGPPPYLHTFHHSSPHPPPSQHLTNGGPQRAPDHHLFTRGMVQRSPFSTPHGSPPISREGISINREMVNREPAPPRDEPPQRPPERRSSSSAMSLRHLLS